MAEQVSQILVVGPAWVGDMVMAQSLFIALRQTYPNAAIDVLAPAWSKGLLARMEQIRVSVHQPVGHRELGLRQRYRLGRSLRARGYELAIVLPRSFKSALVPYFARVPHRVGYKGEMRFGLINDMRVLDKAVLAKTVERYVALGLSPGADLPSPLPEPRLAVDGVNQQRLFEDLGLERESPVVALMPGAEYGPAKRWPETHFAQIADQMVARGYQVWLLGSEKDRPVAKTIERAAKRHLVNLCGRTSLEDVIDLLAAARFAVTNDSGLMHVAAAVGCQVVAIYGSSTPDYTPPLTGKAQVLYDRLECSPCFERICPLGHTKCLQEISAQRVVDAMDSFG